jgi:hypothetical protein
MNGRPDRECEGWRVLAYASRLGQAVIDRRLYLPESLARDAERRAKAHVERCWGSNQSQSSLRLRLACFAACPRAGLYPGSKSATPTLRKAASAGLAFGLPAR